MNTDCSDCYHELKMHGPRGCRDTIEGCGPSDNMDVWEEPCDCGGYMAPWDMHWDNEPDDGEDDVEPDCYCFS